MPIGSPVTPTANTDTLVRTIPASTVGECSHIIVCNRGATTATFRVAIADAAPPTAPDNEDYLVYDLVISPNDTVTVPVADYIPTGKSIIVRASTANVSFRACGREVAS